MGKLLFWFGLVNKKKNKKKLQRHFPQTFKIIENTKVQKDNLFFYELPAKLLKLQI